MTPTLSLFSQEKLFKQLDLATTLLVPSLMMSPVLTFIASFYPTRACPFR